MKKSNILSLFLVLGIVSFTINGCGNQEAGEISDNQEISENTTLTVGSELTSYSGTVYYDYVDTAFYNVIDAAPLINTDVLIGVYEEGGEYDFSYIDFPEYEKTEWDTNDYYGSIFNTSFDNIYVLFEHRSTKERDYSIQNISWVPEINKENVETRKELKNGTVSAWIVNGVDISEDVLNSAIVDVRTDDYTRCPIVELRPNRMDETVLAATPEDYTVMFSNNTISASQLADDISGKKYVQIVDEFGSIGLLQYFSFDGRDKDAQYIRIMWYCPTDEKVLTLHFNAGTQELVGREVSNAAGEILESDIRMTTEELNVMLAEAEKTRQEEALAKQEAEAKKFEGINAKRDLYDADFSQIQVGDVICFGSYPFESKWDMYDNYGELHDVCDYFTDVTGYVYSEERSEYVKLDNSSSIISGPKPGDERVFYYDFDTESCVYDENYLKKMYFRFVCGLDHNDGVDDSYAYKDSFYRAWEFHPYYAYGDEDILLEKYNNLIVRYNDEKKCYYSSIYPTFEDYKKVYYEDMENLLNNCPNSMYASYDEFMSIFEDRMYEPLEDTYETAEWDVLAIEDGKALLLAHQLIMEKPYFLGTDILGYDNGYGSSEIRIILNGDVYDTMFNDKEKARILESELSNLDGTDFLAKYGMTYYNMSGHSLPNKKFYESFTDRLFLLSYDEIEKYYGELKKVEGVNWWDDGYYLTHDTYGHKELACPMVNTTEPKSWWLRNYNRDGALLVDEHGIVTCFRTSDDFNLYYAGLRPAMWVSIE